MELYMDGKWKLSKKGRGCSSCRGAATLSAAEEEGSGPFLKGSASAREGRSGPTPGSATATARSFSRRCASLVKEQRARFYIVRRCVTMLICWRDYA